MLMLLLSTLMVAAFGLIIRWAQGRQANLWAVGALNYLVAALFHLTRWGAEGAYPPTGPTLVIGALAGLAYVGGYLFLFPLMRLRGVSVAAAVQQLSVLVPVIFSVIAWGERPSVTQAAGSALALAALPLLTWRPTARQTQGGPPDRAAARRNIILLVGVFVINGCGALAMRGFQETGAANEESLYLAILFSVATAVSVAAWLPHRRESTRRDWAPGVTLGVVNAFSGIALLGALQRLPGVVVFPFQSAVSLLVVMACAWVVWKEQIRRQEAFGIALALGAVVLINLG
jgi:drug/metabolite transporter (DMT)-like permease